MQPITITPGERWCRECGAIILADERHCQHCKKHDSHGLDIVAAVDILQPGEYIIT